MMTKQQLYDIAINPDQPLEKRYEVARQLQSLRISGDVLTEIVKRYPFYTANEIAEQLNVSVSTVNGTAGKYGLSK